MEYIIDECLNITISILLIHIFLARHLSVSRMRAFLCLLLSSCMIGLFFLFHLESYIAILDFILSIFIVCILLKEKWYEKILSFILIYVLTSLVYQSMVLVIDVFFKLPIFTGMDNTEEKFIPKLFTVIILSLILFIRRKNKIVFNLTLFTKITLCVTTAIFSSFLTFLSWNKYTFKKEFLELFAVFSIASITISFFYLLISSKRETEAEKNKIKTQYIESLSAYYKEVEKNELEMRKIRHDFKKHMNILEGMMENDVANAKKYFGKFNEAIVISLKKVPNVGNPLINAILLQKMKEFPKIKINYNGAVDKNLKMNEFDFCTVIVNLLDNALEYSKRNCFDEIFLYVFQDDSMILINVINYIKDDFNKKLLDRPFIKMEKGHGYGIRNIKDVVEKNYGEIEYINEGEKLTAKVQLYIK